MFDEVSIEKENSDLTYDGTELFLVESNEKGKCTASAHIHGAIEFLYITKGEFSVIINGEKHPAPQGTLVVLRSNVMHTVFSDTEGRGAYMVLKIKPSVLVDFAPSDRRAMYLMPFSLQKRGQKQIFDDEEVKKYGLYSVLAELYADIATSRYAAELSVKANAVRLCAALLDYFARCQHGNGTQDGIAPTALKKIYETVVFVNNSFDTDITARECAARVKMSYAYFTRVFKQIAGKSFSEYLCEIRINHAEKELLMSDKSVTEICYMCGFNDLSYFIAKYRCLRGITPYAFRKKQSL